jgi:hypothetical protein
LRRVARVNAQHRCQRCGRFMPKGLHVHHKKPVERTPALMLEPLNLMVLCPECHNMSSRGPALLSWVAMSSAIRAAPIIRGIEKPVSRTLRQSAASCQQPPVVWAGNGGTNQSTRRKGTRSPAPAATSSDLHGTVGFHIRSCGCCQGCKGRGPGREIICKDDSARYRKRCNKAPCSHHNLHISAPLRRCLTDILAVFANVRSWGDTVAKVVLYKWSKIPRAAGALFV